ncbi:phenylalanyl-tRNA synthetase alpha [Nesidiocoris tenuis]|uniref:phenylalanine--tRNA ligase n=1 Tax=Nesidiocoris tenuis TaxID=355587 RepID=A0ABN7AAE6_9HEMI|nr:phenylalanyl-tRNA synthetase alpha [Nesidiocoris tenuis]
MDEDAILIKILKTVETKSPVNSAQLATDLGLVHNTVIGHLNSLKSRGDLIETTPVPVQSWELTDEGEFISKNGSYEAAVHKYIKDNGSTPLGDVMSKVPNAKIGFSKAMANGWVKKEKDNSVVLVVDEINDDVKTNLDSIKAKNYASVPLEKKNEFKKRKLLKEVVLTTFDVSKGKGFSLSLEKPETELTAEMIEDGSWKTKQFKNYNFDALGVPPTRGHLHPLLKVRDEFRKIFLEMGFSEMNTKNYVESSFWNFDALFQPQQHPARDAHDTFFLTNPKDTDSKNFPEKYVKDVKKVHSEGNYGSQGYRYNWLIEDATKNLLRTHTTANSARHLYELAKREKFEPVKYFSIDKVFRNETLDATHLAEFNQIEGLVVDYDLTLGDLIGVLYSFFSKLGITQLQFKPAYNPYTEPSMEIFCFHPGLNKWIEVGNSGMFRPEMLLPMGLPPNVNVIAWGLSLERPAMIKYKFNNIRDLVGPKVQLSSIYENPICQLDK